MTRGRTHARVLANWCCDLNQRKRTRWPDRICASRQRQARRPDESALTAFNAGFQLRVDLGFGDGVSCTSHGTCRDVADVLASVGPPDVGMIHEVMRRHSLIPAPPA